MPSSNDFTPNTVWAEAPASGSEEEITTPTGQTCRAKRMSIENMIAAGLLTEADAITAQVSKHMRKVKGGKGKPDGQEMNLPGLMKDSQAITELITMLDKLMPFVVVSPEVKLHYSETTVGKTKVTKMLEEEERAAIRQENPDKTIVFTDQIGLEDKMFLFDWSAGGLGTMLAFRE